MLYNNWLLSTFQIQIYFKYRIRVLFPFSAVDFSGYRDPEVLILAAQIHYAHMKYSKALDFAEDAAKLDPQVGSGVP